MYTKIALQVCLVGVLWGVCAGQQRAEQLLAQNPCTNKMSCGDCIRTPSCAWCFQTEFKLPRCFNPAMDGETGGGCSEEYIFNPDNEISIDTAYDRNLTRAGKARGEYGGWEGSKGGGAGSSGSAGSSFGAASASRSGDSLVQIRPQRVNLKVRMNQVLKLDVAYAQAQDYPVDLYYLMDLSMSMNNDKEKLSSLGNLLSSTMMKITSNFRIGFGSFVDKVVMPYVSTVPVNLKRPCAGCAAPYGFKNQMSLSMDTDYFEKAVLYANISGNLDAPEGGFDAIMQAIVCKDVIGWRDQTRRLLVFSTDAGFHYAGDGKLGGIVKPNDGECHMTDNLYTHSTIQDYPSIAQINQKVKENAINVIFAVIAEQIGVYEQLSQHIEGSSAGVLSEDSSNVVELVKDQYDKITSTVEMKDNSTNAVEITYYSACLGDKVEKTKKCSGLKVGDVVHFTAEVSLKECPKDPREWRQLVQISPVGVSDSLMVEIDMQCDCPCERPGHPAYEASAHTCSGYGVSACGVCLCAAGHFGADCQCSAAGALSPEQERACRPAGQPAGPLCSNRGTCVCGHCECNVMPDPTKVISGPYCNCDNFTCDMYKGLMCSGPDHGTCQCGKCVCNPEYTGRACQCPSDQEVCRAPGNGEICSGHGYCDCGECKCNVTAAGIQYTGRYCDQCPTCSGRCGEFKDCVLCEVHKRGPKYNPDDQDLPCGDCSLWPIIEEGKIEANETAGEHLCSFYDDEDCLYVYVYSYNSKQELTVRAQQDRECPPKVFILGIVLGVIAAIVLVGLALLMLWKMVTTIHDRREFARFEKERMMAKWDTGENPIYKQATSTFKNPTYAGK